ncbi:MAG: 16S rRNA (guanine(1516)-N(2))-methyltransferase [uncultured Truepera sp.]|uniref:Ribosomal RNA small subunit methyltransferase J n=1 Tax=uncultured Truepera sp. TaxID=543023 RepID=A0A6J4VCF4_9DEIN|nr:MAG: 16S rRNA (guanine(1516)-N(2))-methyltransferase [uncultured Truepera sp.]
MQVAVSWDEGLEPRARALADSLSLPLSGQRGAELLLYLTRERLELREGGKNAAGPVYADFVGGRADFRRRHGGGRAQPLARAVGLRGGVSPTIVDATAGLGRDAFVLASLGARMVLLERSPVVGTLLADGLRRALENAEVSAIAARMTLQVGDAVTYLGTLNVRPDVVYLDPMYPHTDKSALQKKEMRLFRRLVGPDDDAPQLLETALHVARTRVVVKRPAQAPFLGEVRPNGKIKSKNTRFDLYLSREDARSRVGMT